MIYQFERRCRKSSLSAGRPGSLAGAEQQYSLDLYAAGTYLYEVQNTDGLLQRGKLVLTRR